VRKKAVTGFADDRPPGTVLAEAAATDRAGELDAAHAHAALASADVLTGAVWVPINLSPALSPRPPLIAPALAEATRTVVVELEVGVHGDPGSWVATLPPHVLVAIDDVGAGYVSLALVDSLRPAFMKLDRTTVTGIAIDAARQAFVGTLVGF